MSAPDASKASKPMAARGSYGHTASGEYREFPFQPSLGEFPDTIHRATSSDANTNSYVPLPVDWKLTMPESDKGGFPAFPDGGRRRCQ